MRSSGFTLLEVVVALAIAAMGLGALFQATRSGFDNLDAASRYVIATEHAQSRLARIGIESGLVPGNYDGYERDGYHWRVRISPVLNGRRQEGATLPVPTLYAVDVAVSWRQAKRTRAVHLTTWHLGPRPNEKE